MEDSRAVEIIKLRDSELTRQGNFRSLWQDTADYIFPRENHITSLSTPGDDKSVKIYDSTPIFDSQDMASGLSAAMMPNGQRFFDLTVQNEVLAELDPIDRWLSYATEIAHLEIENSNLSLQINETLRSLIVFGTGCLFSEFDEKRLTLNYKDYAISRYQIIEDEYGMADTVIITLAMQAHQAVNKWGEKVSDKIYEAYAKPETYCKVFEFIHIVRPRKKRKPQFKDSLNMPYESLVVDVDGKQIVNEGGFEEFPCAVPRWQKSSDEVYGRGQGTEILADAKMLQQMRKDYIDLCNKFANPPLEVLSTFEGEVRTWPSARNNVLQMNSIQAIRQDVLGNFPITEKAVEDQRELIHRAFFRDVFWQMGSLTGDRRTTVEINERVQEGLQRLALPVARLTAELFKPLITRSVLLLIRNGKIPAPPAELSGQEMGIEFQGRLVLALKQQQARAFMQFITILSQVAPLYPESLDVINADDSIINVARALGLKTSNISTEEQIESKRQARARQMMAQQAMQMGEMAAQGYKGITKAPEEGSLAEVVMSGAE